MSQKTKEEDMIELAVDNLVNALDGDVVRTETKLTAAKIGVECGVREDGHQRGGKGPNCTSAYFLTQLNFQEKP